MKKRLIVIAVSLCVVVTLSVMAVAFGMNSQPTVICAMQNPTTGERVEMFKEIWFKVPANYDKKRHLESWKAEQRGRGYTVEIATEK